MAKTAPNTFTVINEGKMYPLEPVIEGNGAPNRGLADFVRNVNHVYRSLTPTVIFQLCNFYYFKDIGSPIAGQRYLTTVDQVPNQLNMVARLRWHIPILDNLSATDSIKVVVWANTTGVGETGDIDIDTGLPATQTINVVWNAGGYQKYTTTINFATGAAFDWVQLSTQVTSGNPAHELRVVSVTAWIERGDNPVPTNGMDVEPWTADEPLATYMYRKAADQLDEILKARRGVVCSYSQDAMFVSMGRTNPFETTSDAIVLRKIKVRYGPKTARLRAHFNGQGAALNYVEFYTDYTESNGIARVQMLLPVAYNFAAGWQTTPVQVAPTTQTTGGETYLHVALHANAGTTFLGQLCIWEEPV